MKLVYAVEKEGFNSPNRIGVRKKVYSMIRFFESKGISTQLCEYEWDKGFPTIHVDKDTNILYFRRMTPSIKLILKLYALKRNRALKIVMEIPTYPFSGEQENSVAYRKKISNWVGEKLIHLVLDRIVVVGSNERIESIYNVPIIHANNGIFFEDVSIASKEYKKDQLDLIAVSSCFFWHGYDRLINGMRDYYNTAYKKIVNFHIVGEGDCLNEYKKIAEENGLLNKHIFFYGKLEGKELDAIYNKADIAVDCLACHRKKVFFVSALKVREYVAKGLPFVTANKVDVYNEVTKEYILEVPADETNIDLNSILDFYTKISEKSGELNDIIRKTFRPYCEWEAAYSEVIKYLINACKK